MYTTTAFLCFCCAALGVIPNLLHYKLNMDGINMGDDIPLRNAANSLEHQFAIVACLASYFPLIVELFTDTFFYARAQRSAYNLYSQWTLVVVVTVPNILMLYHLRNFENYYEYIPWLISFRGVIVAVAIFSVITEYGAPVWTKRKTGILVLSYSMGIVFAVYGAFNINSAIPFDTFQTICYCITSILIIYLTILWFRHLLLNRTSKSSSTSPSSTSSSLKISFEEYCCTLHLLAAYTALIGFWVLRILFAAPTWATTDSYYLAGVNYIFSIVGVFMVIFEGRITREEILQIQAREKDIDLNLMFSEEIIRSDIFLSILADKSKLSQVIWNLLSNAIKFTKTRNNVNTKIGRVPIVPEDVAHNDCIPNTLRIDVIDNGPGISP
eukprot:gene7414-15146_t